MERREFLHLGLRFAGATTLTGAALPLHLLSKTAKAQVLVNPLSADTPDPSDQIAVSILNSPDIPPQVQIGSPDILKKFIDEAINLSSPADPLKNLGYRLSNPWRSSDENFWQIAYQRAILKMELPSGNILPAAILDKWHTQGLDPALSNDKLQVTVPEKVDFNDGTSNPDDAFKVRLEKFVPDDMKDYLIRLRSQINLGAPTAFKDYGPYKVVRLTAGAIQYWTSGENEGSFEHILIGDVAAKIGPVPDIAVLPKPADEHVEAAKSKSTPPASSGKLTLTDVNQIIAWAASQMGISAAYAMKIVGCESSFNPRAFNPRGGYSGLWQLSPIHAAKFAAHGWNWNTDKFDPYKNTVIAIEVKRSSGLGAWSCA